MNIEPNTNIGMDAISILVNEAKVELQDGAVIAAADLQKEGNAFNTMCTELDPNLTYINVLLPDQKDRDLYFTIRDIGQNLGIHVQSVTYKTQEAWDFWESIRNARQQ